MKIVHQITIDPLAKAVYFRIAEGKVLKTKEVAPEVFVDFGENNKLLGIELLNPGTLKIRSIVRKFNLSNLNKTANDFKDILEKTAVPA